MLLVTKLKTIYSITATNIDANIGIDQHQIQLNLSFVISVIFDII